MTRLAGLLTPVAVMALLLISSAADARDIHMATTGADTADCGGEANPCQSLGGALAVATDGDTLRIDFGQFETLDVLIDKDVFLQGRGANATTLTGSASNRVLRIAKDVIVTIQDIAISDGRVIANRGENANGGGIFNEGSLTLRRVTISNNTATGFAGIAGKHGSDSSDRKGTAASGTKVECKRKQLKENKCDAFDTYGKDGKDGISGGSGTDGTPGGHARGGAIFNAGHLTLENSTLLNNTASGGTGGIGGNGGNGGNGQRGGNGSYLLVKALVPVCKASYGGRGGTGGSGGQAGKGGDSGNGHGGGVYTAPGAQLHVVNSKVLNNIAMPGTAGAGGAGGEGGTAGSNGSKGTRPKLCPNLTDNEFLPVSESRDGPSALDGSTGRTGSAFGGGLFFAAGSGSAATSVQGTLIAGNMSAMGGGIFAAGTEPFSIEHASFIANEAKYFGPAAAVAGPLKLVNSLAAQNVTEAQIETALAPNYLGDGQISFHRIDGAYPFAAVMEPTMLSGNCIEGKRAEDGSPTGCIATFVAGAGAGEDGIIGTQDDDYRLALDSPALDSADPDHALTVDMNGFARDFDFEGIGVDGENATDPGAFETSPEILIIGKAITPPQAALDDNGVPFNPPEILPSDLSDNLFWHGPSRRLFLIDDLRGAPATLRWRTTPFPSASELAQMTAEEIAAEEKVDQWIAATWPEDAPRQLTGSPLDTRPAEKKGYALAGLARLTSAGTVNGNIFVAGAPGTHSVLRFLPSGVDPNTDPVPFFQIVRAIDATPAFSDHQCRIGTELGHEQHQDPVRTGFIADKRAPYDPRAYDAAKREGQIFPVGRDAFTVAWYRRGALGLFYADTVVEHRCDWPAEPPVLYLSDHGRAPTIDLPIAAEVYRQPDDTLPGKRLNAAHAFVAPLKDGLRLVALRYPSDTNARNILVRGRDETGDVRHAVYRLAVETEDAPLNAVRELLVGEELKPPAAIALADGGNCAATSFDGPVYRSRNGGHWAKAEAGPAAPIRMNWHYRKRSGFDGGPEPDDEGCVPWLPDLSPGKDTPLPLTALAKWPKDAPAIPVGKTRMDDLNGLSSAKILHGQSLGVRLFDPFAERSVPLKTVPSSIEPDENGYFANLPRHLAKRVWFENARLRIRGRRDNAYGSARHPLLYLNILSDADGAELKALSDQPEYHAAVDALIVEAQRAENISRTEIIAGAKALSTGAVSDTGHISIAVNDTEAATGPFAIKVFEISCPAYVAPVHAIAPPGLFDETMQLRYGADFGGETDRVRIDWRYSTKRPPTDYGPWSDWGRLPGSADFDDANDTDSGRGVLFRQIGAPSDLTLQDLWILARARGYEDVCPSGDDKDTPSVSGETVQSPTSFARPAFAEGWLKRVLGRLNAFQSRQQNILLEGVKLDTSLLALAGKRYEGDVPLSVSPDALSNVGLIEAYETVLRRARKLSIDRPMGGYDPDAAPGGGDPLLMASARIAQMYEDMASEAVADFSDPTLPVLTQIDEQIARSTTRRAFEGQVDTALEEELALLRGLSPATSSAPVYNRLRWNTERGDPGSGLYAGTYGQNFQTDTGDTGGPQDLHLAAARAYPQGHGDAWGHYLSAQKSIYRLLRAPRFEWPHGRSTIAVVGGGSMDIEYAEERQFAAISAAKAEVGVNIAKATYRRNWSADVAARLAGFSDRTRVILRDPETGKRQSVARAWGGDDWARRAGHAAYLDWVTSNSLLPEAPCGRADQDTDCDPQGDTVHRSAVPELFALTTAHERVQSEMDQIATGLNPLGLTIDDVPFGIDPNRVQFERAGHFGQVAELAMRELESARAAFDRIDLSNKAALKTAEKEQALRTQVASQEADLRERLIRIYGRPYPEDVGPGRTYPGGQNPDDRYVGPDIYHYDMIDADIGALFGEDLAQSELFGISFAVHDDVAALLDTRSEILTPGVDAGDADSGFLVKAPDLLLKPLDYVLEKLGTDRKFTNTDLLIPNPDVLNAVSEASGMRTVTLTIAPELGGVLKPDSFTSPRPAYGEIQIARTAMVRELAGLHAAVSEYENDLEMLGLHIEKLEKLVEGQEYEQQILKRSREKILTLQAATLNLSGVLRYRELAAKLKTESEEATITGLPTVVGTSNDPLAPARAGIKTAGAVTRGSVSLATMGLETTRDAAGIMREQIELDTNFQLLAGVARNKERLDETQWILESAQREPILRLAVLQQFQTVKEAEMRYRSTLDEGRRLLVDLARLRRETTATVLTSRYRDALNRALRAEALKTYNDQVDAAARQVFRAALAYDYETIGSGYTKGEFNRLLQAILHERSIGDVNREQTARGRSNGLAGILAELIHKYETAFKPSSGFLHARDRAIVLSLRKGLFEIGRMREVDEASDDPIGASIDRALSAEGDWQQTLTAARRADLRTIPEFVACCLTGQADREQPAPGLAFSFETKIGSRLNLFGNRLENDYQAPANAAAHRLSGVAVVLKGYDADVLRMSPTPQAFLIPVGRDVTRGKRGVGRRTWRVRDVFSNDPARQREMIGMSAYAGIDAFMSDREPYSTGLIGRSLENTKWMLIIPAQSFKANGEDALDTLLGNGGNRAEIEDIELRLRIYSYNEG